MEKTRENVMKVAFSIHYNDEWYKVSRELCDVMWKYIDIPEDSITKSIWEWKWMMGVSPAIILGGKDTINEMMEITVENLYGWDWNDIIDSYRLPNDDEWKQMLYHFNNI